MPKPTPAATALPQQEASLQGAPVARMPALLARVRRSSKNVIYEAMSRGGSPFGRPFTLGLSSLTVRIVRALRQRSFFAFESFDARANTPSADKTPARSGDNKFTQYAAGRARRPSEDG